MRLQQRSPVRNREFRVSLGKWSGPIEYSTSARTELPPTEEMVASRLHKTTLQLLLPITPFHHHLSGPRRGKVTRQSVKPKPFLSMGSAAIYGEKHMSKGSLRCQSWGNAAGASAAQMCSVCLGRSGGARRRWGSVFQIPYFKKGNQGHATCSVCPCKCSVHAFESQSWPRCDWLILLLFISDWGEPRWMSPSCQKVLGQSQLGQERALRYSLFT